VLPEADLLARETAPTQANVVTSAPAAPTGPGGAPPEGVLLHGAALSRDPTRAGPGLLETNAVCYARARSTIAIPNIQTKVQNADGQLEVTDHSLVVALFVRTSRLPRSAAAGLCPNKIAILYSGDERGEVTPCG